MSKEKIDLYKDLKEEEKNLLEKKLLIQNDLKVIKEQQDNIVFELISSDSDDVEVVEEESYINFKPDLFSNMMLSFILSDDRTYQDFNNYLKEYGEFNFRLKADGQWDYKKQPVVNKKILIKTYDKE